MSAYLENSLTTITAIDGQLVTQVDVPDIYVKDSPPLVATTGDRWYDPTTNKWYIYGVTGWVEDTNATTTNSNTAPTTASVGDYWYNPDTGVVSIWNGTAWVPYAGMLVSANINFIFKYGGTTVLSLPVTRFNYSNALIIHKALQFNYSDVPIVNASVVFGYSQTIPVSTSINFSYRGEDGKIEAKFGFFYDILNNRLKFPLNKSLSLYYDALSIKPCSSTIRFNYSSAMKVSRSLRLNYADTTKLRASVRFNYSKATAVQISLRVPYKGSAEVRKILAIPYRETTKLSTKFAMNYGATEVISSKLTGGWLHTSPVTTSVQFNYEISAKQYVLIEGKFGYSIQNNSVQSISTEPTFIKNNKIIDYIVIKISCDENSPYWVGDVSLARIEDFAQFNIKDVVQVIFNGITFNFIVDGKNLNRGDNASQSCQLTLISPAALLDAPFRPTITKFYDTAQLAKTVVEEMVGTLDWQLPNWVIPVEQCQFTNETPMGIARKIVQAVGGVIESNPNGSLVCRKTYPVSIPDYPNAEAVMLSDSDLFSVSEQIAPSRVFNRVDVYAQLQSNTIQDTLEFIEDVGNPESGTIYGYPSPYRDVTLSHTSDTSVTINPIGDDVRTHSEFIEFRQGLASTTHPINSIVSIEWKYNNLGGITFDGKNVYSNVAGESLLRISYTVKSKKFRVAGKELSQFVLSD